MEEISIPFVFALWYNNVNRIWWSYDVATDPFFGGIYVHRTVEIGPDQALDYRGTQNLSSVKAAPGSLGAPVTQSK
jgi:hypothetical protein